MDGSDVDEKKSIQVVTITASAICEDLYFFDQGCSYDQRSKPLATVIAVYSFEGLMADLRGLRGTMTPSIFRAIRQYMAERGCARVEWRRDNTGVERARAYDLIANKFVTPLFTQI